MPIERSAANSRILSRYLLILLLVLQVALTFCLCAGSRAPSLPFSLLHLPVLAAALLFSMPKSLLVGAAFGLSQLFCCLFWHAAPEGNWLLSFLPIIVLRLLLAALASVCFSAVKKRWALCPLAVAAVSFWLTVLYQLLSILYLKHLFPEVCAPVTPQVLLSRCLLFSALTALLMAGLDRLSTTRVAYTVARQLEAAQSTDKSCGKLGRLLAVGGCTSLFAGALVLCFLRKAGEILAGCRIRISQEATEELLSLGIRFGISAGCLMALFCALICFAFRLSAEARREAQLDAMTGVRHNFAVKREIASRLSRTKEKGGTLIVLDVDDFKKINDTYGHPFGDSTLSKIAAILQREVRESDVIGRLGGDEFCIFLADCSRERVSQIVESIQRDIQRLPAPDREQGGITCSIGVTVSPQPSCVEKLYHQADQALYAAKGTGKNSYCFYQE